MRTVPKLSVIVFAFNEENNAGPVLHELRDWLLRHEPDSEIVFIDDGSTDRTAETAAKALRGIEHQVLRHPRKGGIGAAIKSGARAARAPWVTFMPADGQIPPSTIGTLREAAKREAASVVFSVYEDRDDGLHRRVLSAGLRGLIWAVHGVRMRSDGPYLFQREVFDPDELRPDTFFLNFEFPIRVLNAGVPSVVVSAHCRPRRSGRSKSAGLKRVLGVFRDLVLLRLRRSENYLLRER